MSVFERAKNKLVPATDLELLLEETEKFLCDFLTDAAEEKHLDYTTSEICKLRNALIGVATIRIGRRSLEMVKMKLNEVEDAKKTEIDGKLFWIVNVVEQKNTFTGKPAPVVFEEQEFKALQIYMRFEKQHNVEQVF